MIVTYPYIVFVTLLSVKWPSLPSLLYPNLEFCLTKSVLFPHLSSSYFLLIFFSPKTLGFEHSETSNAFVWLDKIIQFESILCYLLFPQSGNLFNCANKHGWVANIPLLAKVELKSSNTAAWWDWGLFLVFLSRRHAWFLFIPPAQQNSLSFRPDLLLLVCGPRLSVFRISSFLSILQFVLK